MKGSIVLITGLPGTGKSCYVVAQLPTLKGTIYTNLPLTDKCPREVVKVTTDDVMAWIHNGEEIKGPGYLILDEAQFVFPPGVPAAERTPWIEWLSMTRHRGIIVWLITQQATQIAPAVVRLAEFERKSIARANEKEPTTGIRVSDINQIKSAIQGKYQPLVWIEEFSAMGKGRVSQGVTMHQLNPAVFEWYDSFNVDKGEGVRVKEEWEEYPLPWLLLRVIRRNLFGVLWSGSARLFYLLLMVPFLPFLFPFLMRFMTGQIAVTDRLKPKEPPPRVASVRVEEGMTQEEISAVLDTSPAPKEGEENRERINRVGSLIIVAGRLYDASSALNQADPRRDPSVGTFGKAGDNGLHRLPGRRSGAGLVAPKWRAHIRQRGVSLGDDERLRDGGLPATPGRDGAFARGVSP